MAVPASAKAFSRPMDPSDLLDWQWTFTRGDDDGDLLQEGEEIAEFTLRPALEAAALGLTVRDDGLYAPTLDSDLNLVFYPEIAEGQRGAAMFNDPGVKLGVEFTGLTTHSPARRIQRTIVLQVINR